MSTAAKKLMERTKVTLFILLSRRKIFRQCIVDIIFYSLHFLADVSRFGPTKTDLDNIFEQQL